MATLTLENVNVWYGSVQAVRDVSLSVGTGECVAILGPNGAGKTSLFRAISRVVPSTGSITLDGTTVASLPEKVVRQGIAHVLEGRHIFGHMSVLENLMLAEFGSRSVKFNEGLESVLEFFPILRPKLKAQAAELSGGQQQILAIARGLLVTPQV